MKASVGGVQRSNTSQEDEDQMSVRLSGVKVIGHPDQNHEH